MTIYKVYPASGITKTSRYPFKFYSYPEALEKANKLKRTNQNAIIESERRFYKFYKKA